VRPRVVAEVAAGQVPSVTVGQGTAVRKGNLLNARVPTLPGRHIRAAGDDVRPGDVVLDRGQVVGAAQLAALLAAG
jgi:molybdopterin biosynthesis enzyme